MKVKSIFLALAAAVMFLFSSCSKDLDLSGTNWKATYNSSISYMGIPIDMNLNFDLKFVDATNYSMTSDGTMTAMGQSRDLDTDTNNGTYTFDGENGVFDGEQAFSYNKKDKTIVVKMKIDEPEMAEMFGTDELTLVFTQVK